MNQSKTSMIVDFLKNYGLSSPISSRDITCKLNKDGEVIKYPTVAGILSNLSSKGEIGVTKNEYGNCFYYDLSDKDVTVDKAKQKTRGKKMYRNIYSVRCTATVAQEVSQAICDVVKSFDTVEIKRFAIRAMIVFLTDKPWLYDDFLWVNTGGVLTTRINYSLSRSEHPKLSEELDFFIKNKLDDVERQNIVRDKGVRSLKGLNVTNLSTTAIIWTLLTKLTDEERERDTVIRAVDYMRKNYFQHGNAARNVVDVYKKIQNTIDAGKTDVGGFIADKHNASKTIEFVSASWDHDWLQITTRISKELAEKLLKEIS